MDIIFGHLEVWEVKTATIAWLSVKKTILLLNSLSANMDTATYTG